MKNLEMGHFNEPTLPITKNNDEIKAALGEVNLPTLLMSMASLTEDNSWLEEKYAPKPIEVPEGELVPDDSGGYSEKIRHEIIDRAVSALADLRDSRISVPASPSKSKFASQIEFSVAETVPDGYVEMIMEEIDFLDRDRLWKEKLSEVGPTSFEDFKVLIIGAGMSGLGFAAKLKSCGINFEILEKNSSVGGTWLENSYPDCGVDTPNHFYSYSFNRNPDWSGYFSKRDELREYFEDCATKFNVRDHIRFETEVLTSAYDEQNKKWTVTTQTSDGNQTQFTANVLITAVGQLNRASLPEIPGIGAFAGDAWHSSEWNHDFNLEGRKVAVIGTGCSCVQLLPKTAAKAERVHVFQRTPHWVAPARDYYKPVEPGILWALNHIPFYASWHRARMIWIYGDRNWGAVEADAAWSSPDKDAGLSINEVNKGMRDGLTAYIEAILGETKPQYIKHCVPNFPVFGKRLIVDNSWYETLSRDNVNLVSSPISEISNDAIMTEDGERHEVDCIIFATGFKSNDLMWPIDIVGKNSKSIREIWGDTPNAYKGISVPEFPNMFCLYGPNTNIVHGGSIIYQVECQINYIMQCLAEMLANGRDELDVKSSVNKTYNQQVQEISSQLAWGHEKVESWYKNANGRVVNNSPFSLQKYWEVTHVLDPADYNLVS